MNLLLIFSFYSSVIFVNEAVFISQQITEHRLGTVLNTSDNLEIRKVS